MLMNSTVSPNFTLRINTSIMGFVLMTKYSPFAWGVNPVIFTAGIVGNVFLITSVIAQKLYNKSPIFIFLAFISVADTISLLTFPGIDMLALLGVNVGTKRVCNVKYYFYYGCSKVSVYILIAAYVFKLRGLTRPLDLVSASQTKQTVVVCCVIIVLVFVGELYGVILGGLTHQYVATLPINGIMASVSDCNYNSDYPGYGLVHPLITIAIYVAIPGVTLICLSIAILTVLRRSHHQHRQLTQSSQPSADKSVYSSAKSIATILILMSVLHIVTTVVRYIETAIFASRGGDAYGVFVRYFLTSRCVTSLNFSMNFYIQIICSKFFRDAIIPRFGKTKRPTT